MGLPRLSVLAVNSTFRRFLSLRASEPTKPALMRSSSWFSRDFARVRRCLLPAGKEGGMSWPDIRVPGL